MCGIAGILGLRKDAQSSWIKKMTDALRHRGPDDEGFLAVSGDKATRLTGPESQVRGIDVNSFGGPATLLLGHRRLSILDLSHKAHQPMNDASGALWIVYNGEIYNYLELREELKRSGHRFSTGSDTEVLLNAYKEWGEDCLQRLNGMWSFVIYDSGRNVLFGARDRFGVKPFYYTLNDGYFAFASEQKALLKLPFVKKEINGEAVFDYLVMAIEESGEEGFFKGINELKPSHAFRLDLRSKGFAKWKYYDLKYSADGKCYSQNDSKELSEGLRERIFRAVRLRLRSDVEVGTCLSGGLDSSTIVCAINGLLEKEDIANIGGRQKVFTACYEDAEVDESRWAERVARESGATWLRTFPKQDELLKDLEDIVYYQGAPFGSTSIYAQYRVMRLAAENGVKVLLDGQGGDELFSGYNRYYGPFLAGALKSGRVGLLLRELRALGNSPVTAREALSGMARTVAANALPQGLLSTLYGLKAKENRLLNGFFYATHKRRINTVAGRKPLSLNGTLVESITGAGLKSLLRYEDRNSMRFSIESRTPFADDKELIEYAFRIPEVYKIHDGWSKHILRDAMKGVVPEEVRLRKDKKGFSTPESAWLAGLKDELKPYITKDLNEFMDTKEILRLWDALLSDRQAGITNIWRFINLAVWKKVYNL